MAALHEIARQYAEEIRDGIAWVIIWKTGRSWHAESVWLKRITCWLYTIGVDAGKATPSVWSSRKQSAATSGTG